MDSRRRTPQGDPTASWNPTAVSRPLCALQGSGNPRLLPLPPHMGKSRAHGPEEEGDEDDEEDDVAALERRMKAQGMPPAVWKQVRRELRYGRARVR